MTELKTKSNEEIGVLRKSCLIFLTNPTLAVVGSSVEKKTVNTVKVRSSKTLFGALSLRTSRFYWKQADAGNSQQFIMFLHQLHKAHPNKKTGDYP